jgi:hypothetical protein
VVSICENSCIQLPDGNVETDPEASATTRGGNSITLKLYRRDADQHIGNKESANPRTERWSLTLPARIQSFLRLR